MKWLLKLLPTKLKIWLYKLLYKDIAGKGQEDDTELAHINKFEQALLKSIGGKGINNLYGWWWFWWWFSRSSSFAT